MLLEKKWASFHRCILLAMKIFVFESKPVGVQTNSFNSNTSTSLTFCLNSAIDLTNKQSEVMELQAPSSHKFQHYLVK